MAPESPNSAMVDCVVWKKERERESGIGRAESGRGRGRAEDGGREWKRVGEGEEGSGSEQREGWEAKSEGQEDDQRVCRELLFRVNVMAGGRRKMTCRIWRECRRWCRKAAEGTPEHVLSGEQKSGAGPLEIAGEQTANSSARGPRKRNSTGHGKAEIQATGWQ